MILGYKIRLKDEFCPKKVFRKPFFNYFLNFLTFEKQFFNYKVKLNGEFEFRVNFIFLIQLLRKTRQKKK